jgi:hypothetical protein
MDSKPRRTTTPEEEGIEFLPDAIERLEAAVKYAARRRQPDTGAKVRRTQPIKPKGRGRS